MKHNTQIPRVTTIKNLATLQCAPPTDQLLTASHSLKFIVTNHPKKIQNTSRHLEHLLLVKKLTRNETDVDYK